MKRLKATIVFDCGDDVAKRDLRNFIKDALETWSRCRCLPHTEAQIIDLDRIRVGKFQVVGEFERV